MNIEHDTAEWFGRHFSHHHNDQPVPTDQTIQESHMSRITDARNAIAHADARLAEVSANALADAIADSGLGTRFAQPEISLVLGLISAIEHGPQPEQPQEQHDAGNGFLTGLAAQGIIPPVNVQPAQPQQPAP